MDNARGRKLLLISYKMFIDHPLIFVNLVFISGRVGSGQVFLGFYRLSPVIFKILSLNSVK